MANYLKPWLLVVVFGGFPFGALAQDEIRDTGWIVNHSDFQKVYDLLIADGYYPTVIAGRRALFDEFRGVFAKVPSDDFTAYGYHGLTETEYQDLIAWAESEGFLITSRQSFEGFFGDPLYQIVMVYSGKFVPTYSDGTLKMPLVWVWSGEQWLSYYAELAVRDGFSPLTFFLSNAIPK
ncbi:hypothetical protein G3480_22430 [Thiorhodococcus mannitoliphagus]|uniref:Uncharacterized protein n=1 Tax=Thiorhodococcus mannitoliphagus TaxID=329406 RepID=A0A6P1E134_9GAMM|nr:hypothetical protein [Thiorhodococcus mannitoliphagus]NEX23021.1 hypothetical protein [Thiorhodococcus mannitoliphagus]